MGHTNFTMKKNFTRGYLILNPHKHPISLSLEVSLTKALSLRKPPEPLKCLVTVVQEPPAPYLSMLPPLSSSSSQVSRGLSRKIEPPPLSVVTGLLKA